MTFTRQQGQDGNVHLTYFDKEHQLSFVWDGSEGDWIDVSVGGYAEPMIAHIPWTTDEDTTLFSAFISFQGACVSFMKALYE